MYYATKCVRKLRRFNTIVNNITYSKLCNKAYLVLEDVSVEFLGEALYYHAVYVNPSWAKHKKYLGRAGLHKFYK